MFGGISPWAQRRPPCFHHLHLVRYEKNWSRSQNLSKVLFPKKEDQMRVLQIWAPECATWGASGRENSRASLCSWEEPQRGEAPGQAQGQGAPGSAQGHHGDSQVQSTKCKASSWERTGLQEFCCTSFRGTEQNVKETQIQGVFPQRKLLVQSTYFFPHQSDAIRYPFPSN